LKSISATLILLIIWLVLMTGCSTPKKKSMFKFELKNNQINIRWNEGERLMGIFPFLENTSFESSEQKIINQNLNEAEFVFVSKKTGKSVEIPVQINTEKNTLVFSISTHHHHSKNGKDAIGLLFNKMPAYKNGLAFYKYKPVKAWTIPTKIAKIEDLQETDNQFFLWKFKDGTYAAAIPLIGKEYVSTIGRNANKWGVFSKSLVDNCEPTNEPLLAIAFGKNLYQTIENVYQVGLTAIGKQASLRKNKVYPAVFNHFMWCSWNSLGHEINEQNLLDAAESFSKHGLKLPLMLIDDGWSDVTAYGTGKLNSFKANKSKFPNGLKGLIAHLKQNFHVGKVGIWHTYNGYWAGISPVSSEFNAYQNMFFKYQDKVTWTDKPKENFLFIDPKNNQSGIFYENWHEYLKKQGVSFVKVDNQLVNDRISANHYSFAETSESLQSKLQKSVDKHFEGSILNCMSLTTDALYNYASSAIARSSEDYLPNNTNYDIKGGNAAIHVLNNAFNALWLSQMVWTDADMFQTHHPQALYHAMYRAVSGGPIYITDSAGKQNFDLIYKLIYHDGTIIRAEKPGMPTEDCIFNFQSQKPLKVFNKSNNAGIIAAFNVSDANLVKGTISPTDIPDMNSNLYVMYDYNLQTVKVVKHELKIGISLQRLKSNMFYFVPLQNGFAAIGNVEKLNAPQTIMHQTINGNNITISLYDEGTLVVYSEQKPKKVFADNAEIINFKFDNKLLKIIGKDFRIIY
jgi:raffinose synthase